MKKTLFTFSVFLAVICCTLAYAANRQGSSALSVLPTAQVASEEANTSNVGISIGTVDAQLYSESGLTLNYFGEAQYVAQISENTYMGFKLNSDWGYDEEIGEDIAYEIVELVAISSSEESVTIPDSIRVGGDVKPVSRIYSDRNLRNGFSANIKNLTIPATITSIVGNYSFDQYLEAMYMLGSAPQIRNNVNVNTIYVCDQVFLSEYLNSEYYTHASILPYGWEFEWMTVNVGRKGEFAQTYIEMTDANWALGMYVKVTGPLNDTDLQNINNLTSLRKLDLSEAEFSGLPNSFLESKSTLMEIRLPNYITSIPQSAFRYCSALSVVSAPGVTSVGSNAFYSCSKLSEFDLSKVITISENAFYGCSQFNPTDLSSVNSIGSSAFYNTAVREIVIPEGVSTISSSAFYNCTRLTKVTLPNSIKSIGSGAFYCCSSLSSINLPEGISTINSSAFYRCSKLSEITLPSTLESIGRSTFSDCSSLLSIKCKAIVPPVCNGEFTSGMDLNHCTLYIAPFTIDAYRAASYWSSFYIMKPLNEPVKNIYINRPMTFDLLSEDNAVLQENPNMTLDYSTSGYYGDNVGQLSASGNGTLSAGVFKILHSFARRYNGNSTDYRTTLVNNAENMRADSVLCSINFEKNCWHFISFQYDVQMKDIFGVNNTDFVIRQYNSANRAMGDDTVESRGFGSDSNSGSSSSNWENVPADGVLKAGKGYIIQAANNSTNESGNTYAAIVRFPSRNTVTKNKLFTSNNVIVPLEEYPAEFAHNRSWNLVGNPYPCYYDMHYLMDDFSTPIVLWRGTNYQAYSPIDDNIILRPNEAFFVQRPIDADQMVFGTEGRMHYDQAYNANIKPGIYSVSARSRSTSNRAVFNFNIEGCGTDDRTRIVMNEDALMEYELNRDASKFFSERPVGAEIYITEDVKYDICERPFDVGTAILGTRIGTEGTYTISMTGHDINGWIVELTDVMTGIKVNLNEKNYSFDAEVGVTDQRFSLRFKAPSYSGINNINASLENVNGRIINTSGIIVFEGLINDFISTAPSGIYIVVEAERSYKIFVR